MPILINYLNTFPANDLSPLFLHPEAQTLYPLNDNRSLSPEQHAHLLSYALPSQPRLTHKINDSFKNIGKQDFQLYKSK